ncbi:MAG: 50S ribosomal protein L9, partial [Proteobacteria bacterium]|nr:50S ribosomal protein L9 [Pseudomonadota bacterium]
TSRDIAEVVTEAGFKINRNQVKLDRTYKLLGLFPVAIKLHPEVSTEVVVNIARSEEEAKIQEERGEALIATGDAAQEAEERAKKNAAAAAKSTKKTKKADENDADAKAEEVIAAADEAPATAEVEEAKSETTEEATEA